MFKSLWKNHTISSNFNAEASKKVGLGQGQLTFKLKFACKTVNVTFWPTFQCSHDYCSF